MPPRLRVYPPPDDGDGPLACPPAPSITITLGELLPLVALAHRQNYLWLKDFLDDDVRVTPDLFEVLQAFRVQRPSA